MKDYMFIAVIILSVMLTVAILLQAHGGMGGAFGGEVAGQYKTRRGLEKTVFQLTIGISALFFVLVVVVVFLLR